MAWPSPRRWIGDALLIAGVATVDLVIWNGDNQIRGGGVMPLWVVPTVAVVVYATLIFRWRHPCAIFILQWTYSTAGLLLPYYEPFAGLLISLHAVSRRCSPRVANAALTACIVPFGINIYNAAAPADGNLLMNLIISGSFWVALTLLVWGLARTA